MPDEMMDVEQNVSNSYDREDFVNLWLRIGADIKIRQFQNINDIPEFHQLPNQLQTDLNNKMISINNDSEVSHRYEHFKNFHAILSIKNKQKYLAIYRDTKPSMYMRTLISSIEIGGVFFIWTLFKNFSTLPGSNPSSRQPFLTDSNSTDFIAEYRTPLSGWYSMVSSLSIIIPLSLLYILFRKWFSTPDSIHNNLIRACLLKKLEIISNTS